MQYSSTGQKAGAGQAGSDAGGSSVVVLVGRTGLDAALRLDDSVELVRVKTASEAIAAVATESASRGNDNTAMAVIVSEEVRDGLSVHDQSGVTGVQRFARVLRNLRPDIEVMFLGMDGVTADMVMQATRPAKSDEADGVRPDESGASDIGQGEQSSDVPAQTMIVDDGISAAWASAPKYEEPVYQQPSIEPVSSPFAAEVVKPAAFAPSSLAGFGAAGPHATYLSQPEATRADSGRPELAPPPLAQVLSAQVVSPAATNLSTGMVSGVIPGGTVPGVVSGVGVTGLGAAGISSGAGLPSVQAPVGSMPSAAGSAPRVMSTIRAPLAPPAVISTAAMGAIGELGSRALFGGHSDDAAMEIGAISPGDALLVRSLLRGQDVQPVAMELLRARSGDNSLEVLAEPVAGKLSVPLGEQLGWLCSARAERADQLRPHAGWLAGWLRLRDQQAVLADAALKDALTGAWNRRYLDAFLSRTLQHARESRQFVTVMLFDIDNFKHFNDKFGHDAGDRILKEVVDVMRSMVRPTDRVCRIGGDEFAVVFHDPQGPRQIGSRHPSTVEDIARRFQQRIAEHKFPVVQAGSRLTISGGLATFPWDGLTQADVLAHADALSMASKRAGKNAIVLGG